jgi:hypothetical protein
MTPSRRRVDRTEHIEATLRLQRKHWEALCYEADVPLAVANAAQCVLEGRTHYAIVHGPVPNSDGAERERRRIRKAIREALEEAFQFRDWDLVSAMDVALRACRAPRRKRK